MPYAFSRFLSVVCAAICLISITARAEAEVRAYSANGTAQFVSPTDFVGAGHATHLGAYSEVGSVAFFPTGDAAVLRVEGTAVYTAANGDELHAVISGELNLLTGVIDATVSYAGGTGRFEKATGTADLDGQLLPGGAITVSVKGTIDF